jgi:hypothetical protein
VGLEPPVPARSHRYLPYDGLTPELRELRVQLRAQLRRLTLARGEVLHAVFAGAKAPGSDVENVLLYNVDDSGGAFAAARDGLRFELATPPLRRPPEDVVASATYLYHPMPPTGKPFVQWRPGRALASFEAVDLGAFPAAKRLEQIWLAIHRHGQVATDEQPFGPAPFGVRLTISAPGASPAVAPLVKPVIDGVVCALQAHTDATTVAELAARLLAAGRTR